MGKKLLDYFQYNREKSLKIILAFVLILLSLFILFSKGEEDSFLVKEEAPPNQWDEVGQENPREEEAKAKEVASIFIHITGAIHKEGVIEAEEGIRLYQAIERAGGLTAEADTTQVNMALTLKDEDKIHIPLQGETTYSSQSVAFSPVSSRQEGLVNINTADSASLETLTGIGPSTAAKIIQYRNQSGFFANIEDIKKVSGIGEKTFEKFKDKICI